MKYRKPILITLVLLIIATSLCLAFAIIYKKRNTKDMVSTVYLDGKLSYSGDKTLDLVVDHTQNTISTDTTLGIVLNAKENTTNYSKKYNLYLKINANDFIDTTDAEKILLEIKDANNDAVTSLENLTYDTENKGFDITKKDGLIQIANEYLITASEKSTSQTWTITLKYINLDEYADYSNATKHVIVETKYLESEDNIEYTTINTVLGTIDVINEEVNYALPANGKYVCTIYDDGAYNPVFTSSSSNPVYSDDGLSDDCKNIYKLKNNETSMPDYYMVKDKEDFGENASDYTFLGDGVWLKETSGIYASKDDLGTSYYYRGDVNNNWFYFNDAYWKILRINGDGSLRLIYYGTEKLDENNLVNRNIYATLNNKYDDITYKKETNNGITYDVVKYNTESDKQEYAGYMYEIDNQHGLTNASNIKKYLDHWYEENFANKDSEQNLSDILFCNDRVSSANQDGLTYFSYTRLVGDHDTVYKLNSKGINPSLYCSSSYDLFSKNKTDYSNGALTYQIGLLTADEAVMAGIARTGSNGNVNNYLYFSNSVWTVTPANDNNEYASVFALNPSSYIKSITATKVDEYLAVIPVISIKSNASISGNGSINNPYIIK